MRRDKGTLRFALAIPVFQLVLFGLIDTNVKHVPTAVFDQSQTPDSREMPVQPFPLLLFNPDSRSANLLIPGLVAILLTFSGTILAAFSIVRERERGTLEQLMVTPASPVAVVIAKLLPYLLLGFVQLLLVLVLM